MQFVTEGSFNEAGEAGDKDLQAERSHLKHFNGLNLFTQMIYGQSGTSWCSFYLEQSGLGQLIKLRIKWRAARVSILSELKEVRNFPQNWDIFQSKKTPIPKTTNKADDGKTDFGGKCIILIIFPC